MNNLELQSRFLAEKSVTKYFKNSLHGQTLKYQHCRGSPKISSMKLRLKFFHCNAFNSTFPVFTRPTFVSIRRDL